MCAMQIAGVSLHGRAGWRSRSILESESSGAEATQQSCRARCCRREAPWEAHQAPAVRLHQTHRMDLGRQNCGAEADLWRGWSLCNASDGHAAAVCPEDLMILRWAGHRRCCLPAWQTTKLLCPEEVRMNQASLLNRPVEMLYSPVPGSQTAAGCHDWPGAESPPGAAALETSTCCYKRRRQRWSSERTSGRKRSD